jgi:hypothetical protein
MWRSGFLALIGLLSFWIVSNGHYYHQLKLEDVILNVVLTSLWLLIISYLMSPAFKIAVRGFKNIKEGKKFFLPSGKPKKRMPILYKFLLGMVGFDLFFMVVKAVLCMIDPRSCHNDGFALFIIMFGALFMGVGFPWIIYKLVQWTNILKNAYALLVFAVIAVAGAMIEGVKFHSTANSPWTLLVDEVSFLLNWTFLYLLGFGFCKAIAKKYRQFLERSETMRKGGTQ